MTHHLKKSMLLCLLAVVLMTMPLLTPAVAEAAPLTCGAWSIIKSHTVGSGNNHLNGVATVSASNVWAVGSYDSTNGDGLIKHWNGTVWKFVSSPSLQSRGITLNGVATVSASDVWAVGDVATPDGQNEQTLIEHWNGASWSIVASPNPSPDFDFLYGVVAISASDVWAVGTYGTPPDTFQETLIEHWNGMNWSVISSPNPGNYDELFAVVAVSASDIWAVGDYVISNGNGIIQTLTEHWNGTNWNAVASPNPTSYIDTLSAVTGISSSDVWAVGSSETHSGPTLALIEHWDGTSWSIVSSPNPGGSSSFAGVTTISASSVWAVGDYGTDYSRTLIEQWNGTSWNIVASPNLGIVARLTGVAQVPGTSQIWAVGVFIKRGSPALELTEFYC